MKISKLGEFGLIRLLADIVDRTKNPHDASWQKLLIGISDDAAAWKTDDAIQLATTDSMIQDVHFDLSLCTWAELGWKSMAANLSDIAAMGGVPYYALVSLALPGDIEADGVANLYRGMVEVGNRFGVAIVGGNVSAAEKVMVAITVFGVLKGKEALKRSAARIGDLVAITGYTGLSTAGLKMLKQNLKFDSETNQLLREAHLKPMPRVKEGQALLRCGVKAAIDISDGLIADLAHVCKASRVSARIRRDLVPIHPTLRADFKDDAEQLALSGGEDYELLFTAPGKVIDKVKKAVSCSITVIGEITEGMPGQVTLVDAAGNTVPVTKGGWDHFKSKT